MYLKYLDCFVRVATNLSFSKTAQELNIAQSAVSRQIKLLEEDLAVTLLTRDNKSVRLTSAGESFYSEVKNYFSAIHELAEKTKNSSQQLQGSISIGSLMDVGQNVFFKYVLEFSKTHENIQFNVEYLKHREIAEKMQSGALDFGILSTHLEQGRFKSYLLMNEKIVLVTRSGNKKFQVGQKEVPLITYRKQDSMVKTYFSKKTGKVKTYKEVLCVNSRQSMIEALEQSHCYAVAPLHSVAPAIQSGKLQLAHDSMISQPLYLVTHDYKHRDKKLVEFQKFLLARTKNL
jgi:DNA-binding transcriptional LysR family regulator